MLNNLKGSLLHGFSGLKFGESDSALCALVQFDSFVFRNVDSKAKS